MSDEYDNRQELDAEAARDYMGLVLCPRCEGDGCRACREFTGDGSGLVTPGEAEQIAAELAERGR